MRMGIVSIRRKRQRMRRICTRMFAAAAVVCAGMLAMRWDMGTTLLTAAKRLAAVQTFIVDRRGETELTLPEQEIYALQLGVFDDGDRASLEAARLQGMGVHCIVWQGEKMRIVSGVALSREALDRSIAKGQDAYVIKETLPEVVLRLEADKDALEDVLALLQMPDSILMRLLTRESTIEQILSETGLAAEAALDAHPENDLYTQLAQSLASWCDLMEQMILAEPESDVRSYAAVTMCTLCRELRMTLISS